MWSLEMKRKKKASWDYFEVSQISSERSSKFNCEHLLKDVAFLVFNSSSSAVVVDLRGSPATLRGSMSFFRYFIV